MSSGHGSSRRQAYGRRMKDLRTRRSMEMEVDLEGPMEWNRGGAWDDQRSMQRHDMSAGSGNTSTRPR